MPVPDTPYRTRARTRPGTLLLDRNEGRGFVHPDTLSIGEGTEWLSRYPDGAALEDAIARRLGVSPERVLVTAGADDAIDRTCRAFLGEGRVLLTHRPTFEMLSRYAMLTGAATRDVPWARGAFPVDDLLGRCDDEVGLVAVVSPNNPTGSVLTGDDLERVARGIAPTPLLLDLAYIEYADQDLTDLALGFDHVIVARTLSKAWGLAGCRVGYALGAPPVIRTLRAAGAPYPVSAPSLRLAASAVTSAGADVSRHVEAVRSRRSRLAETLVAAGAEVVDSQANFVLAEFGDRAAFVRDSLAALDVLVRDFTGLSDLRGALRVSVPTHPEQLEVVASVLATICAPEAMLFDLDGVLVDVRESYRRCVLVTARAFGVEITDRDVNLMKADGNANNDWDVTRRLLAHHGVDVSLDEVTAEFQRHYLGDGGVGLVERERALVAPELLARIAARFPLAVVTGRPRTEANHALQRFGFDRHVRHVVTMEDGPAKPNPEPVRQALRALGVERAWMFGDTPDDVVAARTAGVLPIGIAFTSPPGTTAYEALRASGPAEIFETSDQLEQGLPS